MYAKFSFTVDEDAILIANVKRNPFIFDRNDIRHKDGRLKDDVWTDISDQVGRTGTYTCVNKYIFKNNVCTCNFTRTSYFEYK